MDYRALTKRITDAFPDLSPQLQQAARHVVDRPDDVALLSMRSLALAADVTPSTMVRLAQSLGYEGYNEFRELFQQRLRVGPSGYVERARDLQNRGMAGVDGLMKEVFEHHVANLRETFGRNSTKRLVACANALVAAKRIFVLGLRGSFPPSFFFYYVYSMYRGNAVLVDGRGATFADQLRSLDEDDALLCMGSEPYTRETVRTLEFARARGATTVVMTDSPVSPLAEAADLMILIRNESPSFYKSVAPMMAVVESLIMVMVAAGGEDALRAIEDSEHQLENFGAYWRQHAIKKRPRGGNGAEP